MAYKYYDIYLSNIATTPQKSWENDLQALINDQFANASNIYTIQEELTPCTPGWSDVDVRITHIVDANTGEKLGDDWKNLIFKDITHISGLGYKYQFDSYVWLNVNTDYYKYVTKSAIIRRCNYDLKWYDLDGVLKTESCIIDYYKFTNSRNLKESNYLSTGNKTRYVLLQNNYDTQKIVRDYRFIIDKIAYKVVSWDSITKYGLYELTLEEHQINSATDDLINKIAIPTKVESSQSWG